MRQQDFETAGKRELLGEWLGGQVDEDVLDEMARQGDLVRLRIGDRVVTPGSAVRECVVGLAGRVRWSSADGTRAMLIGSPWIAGGEPGGDQSCWEFELRAAGAVLVWVGDRRSAVLAQLPAAWRLRSEPTIDVETEVSTVRAAKAPATHVNAG